MCGNLTFQGKTLIIKSYIVSIILFEMEARGIPQKHVNTLDMLIKNFVWDNKQPLVSKSTIRNYGGLSVPNINSLKKCVNVKFLYNVINSNDENWHAIGET